MTSLIRSIALKNFKGFSEEIQIDIKPITLLFGANSAGKSSVLQALQYVREILERGNLNADKTLQGGEAVDLGGFQNLVNNRDVDKRIEISINMELGAESIPDVVPEAFEDWQTSDNEVFDFYREIQRIRNKVEQISVKLVVGWSNLREIPIIIGYEIGVNCEWCIKIESSLSGRDPSMSINRLNPIFLISLTNEDYELGNNLLHELDGWIETFDLGDDKFNLENDLYPISVLPEILSALREAGMESPGSGMRSWLTDFNGALPKIDRSLSIPTSGVRGVSNIYKVREFTSFLSWLTIGPAILLRDQLKEIRYLGPLRKIPQRGFEASLSKNDSAWSDGMAAWDTLLKNSQQLVQDCSEWMYLQNKLNTGYGLRRFPAQEMDLSAPIAKEVGKPKMRIRLTDQAGLEHQPPDVGVGISQVLPVVVAAQEANASIVCIEQPELHIHPSVQVGLGDLFIDGAKKHGLSFLIETHSEHLILRILRRIRETNDGTLPETHSTIFPKDVGIICLNKLDENVSVSNIEVTNDGEFKTPWPKGFFEERGPELF